MTLSVGIPGNESLQRVIVRGSVSLFLQLQSTDPDAVTYQPQLGALWSTLYTSYDTEDNPLAVQAIPWFTHAVSSQGNDTLYSSMMWDLPSNVLAFDAQARHYLGGSPGFVALALRGEAGPSGTGYKWPNQALGRVQLLCLTSRQD